MFARRVFETQRWDFPVRTGTEGPHPRHRPLEVRLCRRRVVLDHAKGELSLDCIPPDHLVAKRIPVSGVELVGGVGASESIALCTL